MAFGNISEIHSEYSPSEKFFSWIDYVIFCIFILLSTAVGLYFTIKDRSQPSTNQYFMGHRKMSVIPVSISLSVSFLSAIIMLGGAAETYLHGAIFYFIEVPLLTSTILVAFTFLPLMHDLKITSVFKVYRMLASLFLKYSES